MHIIWIMVNKYNDNGRLDLGCGQMGFNTNGAAAKVMTFDRLGEKGTRCHFWEYKSRLTGVPRKSLRQKKT